MKINDVPPRIVAPRIIAISTEVGRGHPSYLDSVIALLKTRCREDELSSLTVGRLSRGASRLAWTGVARTYVLGGKGGAVTRLYSTARQSQSDISKHSIALRILGRDLRRALRGFEGICLVAHPLVARILSDVCRTWYVHGEIASPSECAVRGAERIFVPLDETREKLVGAGADHRPLVVTGLMVEPSLAETAEGAFRARVERIQSGRPLTVGFFTSGAYPPAHIRKILVGAESVVEEGMRAVIFSGTKRKAFTSIRDHVNRWRVKYAEDGGEGDLEDEWNVMAIARESRQAETERAGELIPEMDCFVAASHERTNWAVGLGLPLFVLFPLIGGFAPMNFEFARRQGVAHPLNSLEDARKLGRTIVEFRKNGRLLDMVQRGFGAYEIHGARAAASEVLKQTYL